MAAATAVSYSSIWASHNLNPFPLNRAVRVLPKLGSDSPELSQENSLPIRIALATPDHWICTLRDSVAAQRRGAKQRAPLHVMRYSRRYGFLLVRKRY